MTIVIAGGTGFLGTALASGLRADGHRVVVLTRRPRRDGDVLWTTRAERHGLDGSARAAPTP